MNYLSHHFVARLVEANAPPEFYAGNVLPDLSTGDGLGRLRPERLLPHAQTSDLARGALLHFAADKQFHAAPTFADATAHAKQVLRDAPFSSPPPRLFFLAHAFVEIALDGLLLQTEGRALADDFYDQLAACDFDQITAQTRALIGISAPQGTDDPLIRTLRGFTFHRYLYHYETGAGMAEALYRLSRRARLPAFAEGEADRQTLADLLDGFLAPLSGWRDALLAPPNSSGEPVGDRGDKEQKQTKRKADEQDVGGAGGGPTGAEAGKKVRAIDKPDGVGEQSFGVGLPTRHAACDRSDDAG